MINNITLAGRLTKDSDLRYTSDGTATATFSLAVNRPFKSASGEREADFINCVIWRKNAENFANLTRKGSLVGITGRIQTRNYENKEGQRVYVTEVVAENFALLESKKDGASNGQTGQSNNRSSHQPSDPFNSHSEPYSINSDDQPF
jgi:single-strand DNA-binding protein